MSCNVVRKILTESVPDFFNAEEKESGISLVTDLIMGSAAQLSQDHKYLAEVSCFQW